MILYVFKVYNRYSDICIPGGKTKLFCKGQKAFLWRAKLEYQGIYSLGNLGNLSFDVQHIVTKRLLRIHNCYYKT